MTKQCSDMRKKHYPTMRMNDGDSERPLLTLIANLRESRLLILSKLDTDLHVQF